MKKSSKLAIFICFSIIVVLAAVVGGTLFAVNYNLETAPSVEIINDGNSVIVKTTVNENYKGYRFRFTSREETKFIDSEKNSINLSETSLELGHSYNVAVCYLGEIEGNNSKYSEEKTFVHGVYLASSTLSLQEDKLIWSQVEKADGYILYCNQQSFTFDSAIQEVALSSMPGGLNEYFIVAYSDNAFIWQSKASNVVSATSVHLLTEFKNVSLNQNTLILTADSSERLNKINIHVGSRVYETSEFSVLTLVNGDYRYTINISTIYSQSADIGVSPATDEYNNFTGEILWA